MNAWLIEDTRGRCLGECNGMSRWTTPDRAIRYARKQDAEAAIRVEFISGAVRAVEHVWSDEPNNDIPSAVAEKE